MDLLTPYVKGRKIDLLGSAGVSKTVLWNYTNYIYYGTD